MVYRFGGQKWSQKRAFAEIATPRKQLFAEMFAVSAKLRPLSEITEGQSAIFSDLMAKLMSLGDGEPFEDEVLSYWLGVEYDRQPEEVVEAARQTIAIRQRIIRQTPVLFGAEGDESCPSIYSWFPLRVASLFRELCAEGSDTEEVYYRLRRGYKRHYRKIREELEEAYPRLADELDLSYVLFILETDAISLIELAIELIMPGSFEGFPGSHP